MLRAMRLLATGAVLIHRREERTKGSPGLQIVLPAMSDDAASNRSAVEEHLRYILSASSKPQRAKSALIGTKQNKCFGVVIAQGEVVFDYAKMVLGEQAMSHNVQGVQKLHLPRGFGQRVANTASIGNATMLCGSR